MREDARVLKNWRKINCWAQIITRRSRYGFWWFVLNNWFFFNFLTPAHPHAQSLFLFPIVFGINLLMIEIWPFKNIPLPVKSVTLVHFNCTWWPAHRKWYRMAFGPFSNAPAHLWKKTFSLAPIGRYFLTNWLNVLSGHHCFLKQEAKPAHFSIWMTLFWVWDLCNT